VTVTPVNPLPVTQTFRQFTIIKLHRDDEDRPVRLFVGRIERETYLLLKVAFLPD
jgi:hypothetical protein